MASITAGRRLAAGPPPFGRSSWRPWRLELAATLSLALPLAATQLGQILIHGTEVLLLGRLAPASLAAVTIAWTLFYAVYIASMGIAQATAPLIAQAIGAGRPAEMRHCVRHGLLIAFLVTTPLSALLWHGASLLRLLGQDEALLGDAEAYLRTAGLGLPFAAGFIVLRNWTAARGRTAPVIAITWLVLLVNLPLSYGLVFGAFGLPRLEVTGAGIGAAASWVMMWALLMAWCLRAEGFSEERILARLGWPDIRLCWTILRLGLPIAGAMLMETSLFAASTLMMGRIGTSELAAHQVALQLAATTFMVPLGISIAATIRVGIAAGAGDGAGVRRAGWVAAGLGAGFMACCAMLFVAADAWLTGLFLDVATPAGAAAHRVATGLLLLAALFQLADGLQVIGIGALRGLRDTAVPMLITGIGYGAIGLPVCALLGFATPLGAQGIWLGLAAALGFVAVAMLWRFDRVTRPGRLPPTLVGR